MRTIYFYSSFALFMISTIFFKLRLDYITKTKSSLEAEEYMDRLLKIWASFCLKRAGIKVKIQGEENLPNCNCLFVSNHQGYFDIPALIYATNRPIGFIAKKEILKYKFLSYWMIKIHCVFIDRENIRESMTAINKGAEYLEKGYNIAVFPEGTRSKGPKIGEFKKGSMKLATKSGAPVVPVAINGTYKAREGNKWSLIKPAEITITICKPIYVSELDKEDKANLSEIVKSILEANIIL